MTAAKKTGKPAAAKKRGLGRGLEALLGPSAAATPSMEALPGDTLKRLPVKQLQPGKYQPRRTMDDDKLKELAESIKAQGVVQPVVVRQLGKDKYEIVAGERRWRATQLAGLIASLAGMLVGSLGPQAIRNAHASHRHLAGT